MVKARSSAIVASTLAKDIRTGFNCKFCKNQCFKVALAHWDEVQAWRNRSVHLTAGELDIEIEWIFGRQRAPHAIIEATPVLDCSSESTEMSPKSNSIMADEATSQSEPELHTSRSSKKAEQVRRTSSGNASQSHSSDEHTSASDTDDLLLIQRETHCNGKQRAAKRKQQYSTRKITKQPSVQLQGAICKESAVLCRQAALKVLSLGSARVNRVTLSAKWSFAVCFFYI